MNMGTAINSQATVPQNASPRVAKMINFFFVDRSMSFIDSLSANGCFTLPMLLAVYRGWFSDRREGNKKCCQKGSGSTFAGTCSECAAI
jgi:hypothetical protein